MVGNNNFGSIEIIYKDGKLTIIDNDNNSLSNLIRQFLFHKNDVEKNSYKSFYAKKEASFENRLSIIN